MRFHRLIAVTTLAGAALVSACASTPMAGTGDGEAAADPGPFSVILMIGDGTGLNYWSAARLAYPDVSIERFPVVGLVGTTASNSRITDSAAGATAYASGVKTYNGAVGVGPDTSSVETVLERAERRGWATGLVATSTITHATPAAFAAHVPSRQMHFEIAEQMAASDVDVMIGGGWSYFDPAVRPDGQDLLAMLDEDGTVMIHSSDNGLMPNLDGLDRLVVFTDSANPPPATNRSPNLAQRTDMALRVLSQDDDGFFLMVEGSQIDWRGHSNASLNEVLAEVQDFDMAIRTALQFREQRPNTLIIVTADHETGGLALHGDDMGVFRAHYTTDGHTAGMVPLFAIGPGAERFGGVKENDAIGRLIMQLVEDGGPRTR